MSLATDRRSAAAAAIVAFVTAKNNRRRTRDGGASILSPEQNQDLQDDLTDLVADVLIWAREAGLDTAWIVRVGQSHAGVEEAADDETLTLIRRDGTVALTVCDPKDGFTTVARFDTMTDAETFLNASPQIDKAKLDAGDYGLDAPHGVGSDVDARLTAKHLGWTGTTDAAAALRYLARIEP